MANSSGGMSSNPFFMILGLGAGAAALIAIAIAATAPVTGEAVGPGPESVTVDDPQEQADAVEEVQAETDEPVGDEAVINDEGGSEGQDEISVETDEGDGEGAVSANTGAAGNEAPGQGAGEAAVVEDGAPLDEAQAEAEATDGDMVGAQAPDPEAAVVEGSGDAVTPEDTDAVVTPVPGDAPETPAAGDALIPEVDGEAPAAESDAPAAEEDAPAPEGDVPAAEGDAPADEGQTDSGLATDELVVDPDRGAAGGPDPDGGAEPFFPTPSGPEGSDGSALTVD